MSLQIIQRRDYLHNWAAREAESPAKGNLRRGEIAIAIVTDDGTDNGNITEVIGRIGPSDTPTPFSDCPVVFRSPRGFKGADVRPVLVDDAPATNAVLAYDQTAGKFVTVDEDPGTYEEVDGTEGGEGGGNELEEIAPTILLVQSSGLASQAVVDTSPTYTLTVEVIGRPDPILDIEIEETAWPDHANNALNYTTSTAYQFSTDNIPQGVSVSVVDSATLGELGARTYTITGLAVNRSVPMSRVAINARIGASNPAGSSPVTLFATQGQTEFVADPAESAQPPAISSVSISEGGSAKNKIANLATGGTATLTASYVATDFAEGVDNGTVTYQWYEGNAALVGETNASITITNDGDRYNDTQLSVQVSISDLDGSDSRRGYIAIGDYDEGFTELVPSADSRLVYVATDGDGSAAAAAKGRGYYLSSDPEIGPDPTNPVGPIAAYASPVEAAKRIRGRRWKGTDAPGGIALYDQNLTTATAYPDWLLFRRSQTFDIPDVNTAWGTKSWSIGQMLGNWTEEIGLFSYHGGYAMGRSIDERLVVTSWGPIAESRPTVNRIGISGKIPNAAFVSLATDLGFIMDQGSDCANLLIEDCLFRKGLTQTNSTAHPGMVIRRCAVVDNFSSTGHNQGIFIGAKPGATTIEDVTIEECVFDRNGYKENPNEPTTWTAKVTSALTPGQLPAGTGVQPSRTYFDRVIYASTYDAIHIRGNIISRGGGGSSVQMRSGGVAERNLFIFCPQALSIGHPESDPAYWNDAIVRQNTILHDDVWNPPGGFGTGIGVMGLNSSVVVDDNVIAHFHRWTNGGGSIGMAPKVTSSNVAATGNLVQGVVTNNAINHDYGATAFGNHTAWYTEIAPDAATLKLTVTGNDVSIREEAGPLVNWSYPGNIFHYDNSGRRDTPTADIDWGISSGNRYHSDQTNVFENATLATHQANGYDTASTLESNEASFHAAAGWTDPERDIVSYMQSVDPTYVVNEDVYVDDGASGTKQAVRQKVWEALDQGSGDPAREAWAKTAARRYHAFLAFIEKARNNRKGAWDSRWTAEAVSNYIREGYGKASVGGAYTTTIADLGAYT